MANLMDYMVWRGEFGFEVSPWNDVDALMMANLCYLNFHGIDDQRGWTIAEAKRLDLVRETVVAAFEGRKSQFEAMADTFRFGGVRMHHFIALTDEKQALQFSATCYDLPDGTLCIGFRGTDGTFVGWREDFNMSWQSAVPAQEAAVFYLERAAEMDDRPIRLVGHSKGGNLAAYAAACCSPEVQDRLEAVYSFDGPGMDPEVFQSEGYQRIVGKIRSFVPQTSIVGMMMEYHRDYTVVKSDAVGISQHDPLTWQVYGPRFETLEKIDANAETISDTLHDLLEKTDREERAEAVDTLFGLLENTKASNFNEALEGRLRTLTGVAMGTRDLGPEARKAVTKLLGLFLSLGFGNLAERYRLRRTENRTEETPSAEMEENKSEQL
ncbi:MAG: DUF2974 domain-containing protein [Clostridia bacterium]|nr:DUF2974 domain-containing protein [Clostridia bacterium]